MDGGKLTTGSQPPSGQWFLRVVTVLTLLAWQGWLTLGLFGADAPLTQLLSD